MHSYTDLDMELLELIFGVGVICLESQKSRASFWWSEASSASFSEGKPGDAPYTSLRIFFEAILKLGNQGLTTFSEKAREGSEKVFSGVNLWGKIPVEVSNLFPFLAAF